jgi:Family of unknown function (DUF5681)
VRRRKPNNREKTGTTPYHVGPGKPPKGTQFKPGHTGNPKGRPKGSSLQRLLKDLLEFEAGGKSSGELIVEQLIKKACRGNLKAIEIVLDRIEGKARQRIDVGGTDGAPIPISIVETIDRFYGKSSPKPGPNSHAVKQRRNSAEQR